MINNNRMHRFDRLRQGVMKEAVFANVNPAAIMPTPLNLTFQNAGRKILGLGRQKYIVYKAQP
jgi:hypothetical protein